MIHNEKSQKMLGIIQLAIMSVIRSFPEKAYGTAIAKLVSQQIHKEMSDAQVFVTLNRLERQGFVTPNISEKEPSEKKGPGRPKKRYTLTASGLRALDEMAAYSFLSSPWMQSGRKRSDYEYPEVEGGSALAGS